MHALASDASAPLRRAVYALLIVATCAAATGRIATVESKSGKTPFLSANDRSRWSAIRALVDHGTFVLDDVILLPDGRRDRDWYSIDLVRHRGWDGKEHYYSSKPTLPTVLLAGEYAVIRAALGITLEQNPFFVARLMLFFTNVLPLALYLVVLARLIERYGGSDWGRLWVMAAAAFGTFITTFAVTLNNHTLAATTALLAMHAALHIGRDERAGWGWYLWAGFCAAATVANELPAAALLVLLAAALAWFRSPLKTAVGFGLAVLVIGGAALGTNYYAHGSWKTPYAHRRDGPVVAEYRTTGSLDAPRARLDAGELPDELRAALAARDVTLGDTLTLAPRPKGGWMLWDEARHMRYAIVENPAASMIEAALEVREWDNWYEYEGTYWTDERKAGVDRGEPSRWVYAFHCLVGHRGLFSLTPIWLLSIWGVWLLARREAGELRVLAGLVAATTLIVLAFYLVQRPLEDRNYGGVASGLRWMFWFTPLWLLALLPAADRLAPSRWGRGIALLLLAVSVFSAHYASLNPWAHSWLFDYWTYLEWIEY
jgi:hypothetical protein